MVEFTPALKLQSRDNKLINKDKIWLAISLRSILVNKFWPVIKALYVKR
jgi:hypothetical protein